MSFLLIAAAVIAIAGAAAVALADDYSELGVAMSCSGKVWLGCAICLAVVDVAIRAGWLS